MTATVATAVHCPACTHWLMSATLIRGARLRCRSCRTRVLVDLIDGELRIVLDKQTGKG